MASQQRQVPVVCTSILDTKNRIESCHSGKTSCWFDAAMALMFNYVPVNDTRYIHTKSIFELFYDEFYKTDPKSLAVKYGLKKFIQFIESYGIKDSCVANLFELKIQFTELLINILLDSPDYDDIDTRDTISQFILAYLTIESVISQKNPDTVSSINAIVEELDIIFPNARSSFNKLLAEGGGSTQQQQDPFKEFANKEELDRSYEMSNENYERNEILRDAMIKVQIVKQKEYIAEIYKILRTNRIGSGLIAKLLMYYTGFDSSFFFKLIGFVLGKLIFSKQIYQYVNGIVDVPRQLNNIPNVIVYALSNMGIISADSIENHLVDTLKFNDTKQSNYSPFMILKYDCQEPSNGVKIPEDALEQNEYAIDHAEYLLANPLKFDELTFSHVTYELAGIFVNINDFRPLVEFNVNNPDAPWGMEDTSYDPINHVFSIIRCQNGFWIFDNDNTGNSSYEDTFFISPEQKQTALLQGISYVSSVKSHSPSRIDARYFMPIKKGIVSFMDIDIQIPFQAPTSYGSGFAKYYYHINNDDNEPADPDFMLFPSTYAKIEMDFVYHIRPRATNSETKLDGGALSNYNKNKSLYSKICKLHS